MKMEHTWHPRLVDRSPNHQRKVEGSIQNQHVPNSHTDDNKTQIVGCDYNDEQSRIQDK
ncbi:MAG: hypothetical protein SQA66_03200 [Candidatus Fervidibacter sacchari]